MVTNARTVNVGELSFEIIDPTGIQPVAAEIIVDGRQINGVVCLGFGFVIADGTNAVQPIVQVNSRLRMTLPTALDLRNLLNKLLEGSVPSKEQVN